MFGFCFVLLLFKSNKKHYGSAKWKARWYRIMESFRWERTFKIIVAYLNLGVQWQTWKFSGSSKKGRLCKDQRARVKGDGRAGTAPQHRDERSWACLLLVLTGDRRQPSCPQVHSNGQGMGSSQKGELVRRSWVRIREAQRSCCVGQAWIKGRDMNLDADPRSELRAGPGQLNSSKALAETERHLRFLWRN